MLVYFFINFLDYYCYYDTVGSGTWIVLILFGVAALLLIFIICRGFSGIKQVNPEVNPNLNNNQSGVPIVPNVIQPNSNINQNSNTDFVTPINYASPNSGLEQKLIGNNNYNNNDKYNNNYNNNQIGMTDSKPAYNVYEQINLNNQNNFKTVE